LCCRFPLNNPRVLIEWLKVVRWTTREEFMPTRCYSICSLHFQKSDYENYNLKRLKPTAVPAIVATRRESDPEAPEGTVPPLSDIETDGEPFIPIKRIKHDPVPVETPLSK